MRTTSYNQPARVTYHPGRAATAEHQTFERQAPVGPRRLILLSLFVAAVGLAALVIANHVMATRPGGELGVRLGAALTHDARDQLLVFALDAAPIVIILGLVGLLGGIVWRVTSASAVRR
jgi:hypothetical protein